MELRFKLLSILLAFFALSYSQSEKVLHGNQTYFFDFGPSDSEVSDGASLITPEVSVSSNECFGWLNTPDQGFVNEDFANSRDAFLIDGVVGDTLDFLLQIPEGKWWITLFADAGFEDSSTAVLEVNRDQIDLDWHAFQPPSEPYTKIQTGYRMYQGLVSVTDSLVISFMGGNYDARLLGLTLIRQTEAKNEQQENLLRQIVEAGRYQNQQTLDPLYDELKSLQKANPTDPFYSYWAQQLELLGRAELHYERRGWEKYIKSTGLSIWGQLHQAVMLLDGMLNHSTAASNPLYERALFLRGRILYWLGLERGGPNEIARGAADLARLYALYPEDKLVAMYNGERIDLPDACDELPADLHAPRWSNMQRELICRMRSIAHWWVLEQQAENGEFGGKIGDDVELLRWWTPVLLSGDSLSFAGWSKLADEVMRNRKVYKGYSKKPLDVEHASEFIADTAPMMTVCSDDQKYLDRLKYSVDYFMNLWTGMSDNGHRFFRSAWFSSTEVDETPPRNRDQGYNSRAVKAVRYYAWKTGDTAVIRALNEWSDAWLSVAMRTDKGKPSGIIPASVRFPDEAFNGDEESWYRANMFWDYFEWEATPGSKILDQLLFSYSMTGEDKYLEPLIKCLTLIEKYDSAANNLEEGSEAWAAGILKDNRSFWGVAAQWRFLTEDKRFDDLLQQYGTPYVRYRLTADEAFLEKGLEQPLENARYNTPLKTTEAIHTDRVYIKGYEHLTVMLTGNSSSEGLSPNFAVTWEDTNEDFTALVQESSLRQFKVAVYLHSAEEKDMHMRLWQLEPGRYQMHVTTGKETRQSSIEIKHKGQHIPLNLLSKELMVVEIHR